MASRFLSKNLLRGASSSLKSFAYGNLNIARSMATAKPNVHKKKINPALAAATRPLPWSGDEDTAPYVGNV
jgi:hypothetical protein